MALQLVIWLTDDTLSDDDAFEELHALAARIAETDSIRKYGVEAIVEDAS